MRGIPAGQLTNELVPEWRVQVPPRTPGVVHTNTQVGFTELPARDSSGLGAFSCWGILLGKRVSTGPGGCLFWRVPMVFVRRSVSLGPLMPDFGRAEAR